MKRLAWIVIALVAICGLAATSKIAAPALIHVVADSEAPL
jgi:hypothetical protein